MLLAVLRTMAVGTLTLAALPILYIAAAALTARSPPGFPAEPWHTLTAIGWVLLVCFALVAAGMVVIALPLTLILRHLNRESRTAYISFAALAAIVGVALNCAVTGQWIVFPVFTGIAVIIAAITANSWWVHGRAPKVRE